MDESIRESVLIDAIYKITNAVIIKYGLNPSAGVAFVYPFKVVDRQAIQGNHATPVLSLQIDVEKARNYTGLSL